jgi:hypothetical protein
MATTTPHTYTISLSYSRTTGEFQHYIVVEDGVGVYHAQTWEQVQAYLATYAKQAA